MPSGVRPLPQPVVLSDRTETLARTELAALRARAACGGGGPVPEWPCKVQAQMEKQEATQAQALSSAASLTAVDTKCPPRKFCLVCSSTVARATGSAVFVARVAPEVSARELATLTLATTIQVIGERDGWLCVRPPAEMLSAGVDSCWLQQRDEQKGCRWARCRDVAPQHAATGLVAAAGLQMLLFSLERDPQACEHLVSCASELMGALKPLSLYGHRADANMQEPPAVLALGRVSTFVLSLAKKCAMDDAARASQMVSLVLRMAAARGSLCATLEIVQAVHETPCLLQPEHRDCLDLLFAVDQCEEELLTDQFGPVPGSTEELMAIWEKEVFPALDSGEAEPPAFREEICSALRAGDVEQARAVARRHIKKVDPVVKLDFVTFAKFRRLQIAKESPGTGLLEMGKQLDAEWQAMSDEDKEAFQDAQEPALAMPSFDDLRARRWPDGFTPPCASGLPDKLPSDMSGELAACLVLGCLDTLLHRFVGFSSSFCKFSQTGPPPHLVEISALGVLADMLEQRLAESLTESSAFLCLALLRLARVNITWIASQHVILSAEQKNACSKLGRLLLAYMEKSDANPRASTAAIRNEAASGYGAGIAVFLADPQERATMASQLLRQDTEADWHRNLVALVLTNLSSAQVLQQMMPVNAMTDECRESSAESLFELFDAALGVISAEHSRWNEADVPEGNSLTFTSETVVLQNSWTWNGKKDSCMNVTPDGMRVTKSNNEHDYSVALGSVGFTTGRHEWEMRILDDIDSVTVGVCSGDVRLDKCVEHDTHGRAWFWNPHGESGCRTERGTTTQGCPGFARNCTIKFKLDMDAGTLECMKADGRIVVTHEHITGEVFPYVCFDYESSCKLEHSTSYFPQDEQVLEGIPAAARLVRRVMQLLSTTLSSTPAETDQSELSFLAKVVGRCFQHCATLARSLSRSTFGTDCLQRCVVHSALCPLLQSACVLGSTVSSTANAFNRQMLPTVIDLVVGVQELADAKPAILSELSDPTETPMVYGLPELVSSVTAMGARAVVTLLTYTKTEQDASVLLTPGLFSEASQVSFEGEFTDALLQPIGSLMKPANLGLPSVQAERAEQIVILTMLYHAGLLQDRDSTLENEAAAVENVVSEACTQVRTKMHHRYMLAKLAANDLHDDADRSLQDRAVSLTKVWDEVTIPIIAKCRILLEQKQMIGETADSSKWVVPKPYELTDGVFERATDQKMNNGSPVYEAVRAVRKFVLSEPSASAVREALLSRALRNSDVAAGLTSMAELLRAGDHLGRQQSKAIVKGPPAATATVAWSLSARRASLLSFWSQSLAETLSTSSISSSDDAVRLAANDLVLQLTEFLSEDHPPLLQAHAASALTVLATGEQPLAQLSFVLEDTPLLTYLDNRWNGATDVDISPDQEEATVEPAMITLFSALAVQASMPNTPVSATTQLLKVAASAIDYASRTPTSSVTVSETSGVEQGPLVEMIGIWEGEAQQPSDPDDEDYDEELPIVRLSLTVTSPTEMTVTCNHRFPGDDDDEYDEVYSSSCTYKISAADCQSTKVFNLDLLELDDPHESSTFSLFTVLQVTAEGDIEVVLPISDEDEAFASADGLYSQPESRPSTDVLNVDEMTSSERGQMTLRLSPLNDTTRAHINPAVDTSGSTGSPLQGLLTSLAAACHCPEFATATATDSWREALMRIADGSQEAAKQDHERIAALDLLLLSLTHAPDQPEAVVNWLFDLLESTSPESNVFVTTRTAARYGSLPMRRAALAFLARLRADDPWCSCIENQVEKNLVKLCDHLRQFQSDRSVPVPQCWPTLLVLGGSADEWSAAGTVSLTARCAELLNECLVISLRAPVMEVLTEDGIANHTTALRKLTESLESSGDSEVAVAMLAHLKCFEETETKLQAESQLENQSSSEPEPELEPEPESEPQPQPQPQPELDPQPQAALRRCKHFVSPPITCLNGHPLVNDRHCAHICDDCDAQGTTWRCAECDYDLCDACESSRRGPHGAAGVQEVASHPETEAAETRPPGCPGYSLGFRLVRMALVKIALQQRFALSCKTVELVQRVATTLTVVPIATNDCLANALLYCLGVLSSSSLNQHSADALHWSHMHWVPEADVAARAVAAACDQPYSVAQMALARQGQQHDSVDAIQNAVKHLAAAIVTRDLSGPLDASHLAHANLSQSDATAQLIAASQQDDGDVTGASSMIRLFKWCQENASSCALKLAPASHCSDALMVQYARVLAVQQLSMGTPPTTDALNCFAPLFVGSNGAVPAELFEQDHPHYGLGDTLKTQLNNWAEADPPTACTAALDYISAVLGKASVCRHVEPSIIDQYAATADQMTSMTSFYASVLTNRTMHNNGGDRVVAISGRAGWMVDAVVFHFESGRTRHYGGTGGSECAKFLLAPGEFLTKVAQKRPVSNQYLGSAFVFTTSTGRTHELAGSRVRENSYSATNGTLTECSVEDSDEAITGLVLSASSSVLDDVTRGKRNDVSEDSFRGQPNLSYALYLTQTLIQKFVDLVSNGAEHATDTQSSCLARLGSIKAALLKLVCKIPSEALVDTLRQVLRGHDAGELHLDASATSLITSLHSAEKDAVSKRQKLCFSPLLAGLLEVMASATSVDDGVGWGKVYTEIAQVLMGPGQALPCDPSWYTRQAYAPSAAASWCWGAQREMNTTSLSVDGRAVWKTADAPDYSVCLGTSAFPSEGVYEWTMQLTGTTRGVALGVCTALSEAERGRAIWRRPNSSYSGEEHVPKKAAWYMKSTGEIAQLRAGADYDTTVAETQYQLRTEPNHDTLTLRLDCDVGVLRFFKSDGTELGSCGSLEGELFPFVCFDNIDSRCEIVSTRCLSECPIAVADSVLYDFTTALDPALWPVEMDSLLIQYACERAAKTKSSARYLNPQELFTEEFEDELLADDIVGNEGVGKDQQNATDPDAQSTLSRQASRQTVLEPSAQPAADLIQSPAPMLRLRDRTQNSLRARLVLLQQWTSVVSQVLPFVNFAQANMPGTLAHHLCLTKGRLFPDVVSLSSPRHQLC